MYSMRLSSTPELLICSASAFLYLPTSTEVRVTANSVPTAYPLGTVVNLWF
jgi:hypothetical protein